LPPNSAVATVLSCNTGKRQHLRGQVSQWNRGEAIFQKKRGTAQLWRATLRRSAIEVMDDIPWTKKIRGVVARKLASTKEDENVRGNPGPQYLVELVRPGQARLAGGSNRRAAYVCKK
jgi:hypothetical protein